ncbi:hypothetical protein CDD80_3672 [Ophiocordyceps camponoti-rufipedis]|uniref:Phosphoinositide phospholipase C n=1 Tax=Ophiocordyceps camponoti-rufipedis TaxID=2004952 RepID=A0A2C5Y6C1_9HYPO|nr:hypothetical protein CDD80_3672 [Ophiocordyceps camponoti-rufipedis]
MAMTEMWRSFMLRKRVSRSLDVDTVTFSRKISASNTRIQAGKDTADEDIYSRPLVTSQACFKLSKHVLASNLQGGRQGCQASLVLVAWRPHRLSPIDMELNEKVMLPYLRRIFESHAGPDHRWTQNQAKAFVRRVQQADDGSSAAADFLASSSTGIDGFLRYMASADTDITLPSQPCDLSWPLCSYFISSSHNTYLSGNQLSSDSTAEAYTKVLQRGCRCVEIDVWDGVGYEEDLDSGADVQDKPRSRLDTLRGRLPESLAARLDKTSLGNRKKPVTVDEDGSSESAEDVSMEPRVLHGYTLTRDVPFRDVCQAIRDSAFAVTDLPLIVSLEVHCSPGQQAVMVELMQDAWRGLLVTTPSKTPDSLPSPDSLRRKILVKVKYVPHQHPQPIDSDSGDDTTPRARPSKVSKITHALSCLGIYTQAVSFKGWTQPEATMPTHIFSLSESKFLEHGDKNPVELFQHNRDYLMRVYPSGLRIASSNLYPPVFWGLGAQVVALNWQQVDEGMMLNEAMFAGSDGYVLKPEGYRPHRPSSTNPRRKSLSLVITFLAAQGIPLPPYDTSAKRFHPYIKTEMHLDGSAPSDDALKARTRTHRGRDVDLQAEKVSFRGISGLVPELSFVRFTIRDDEIGRDDLAAWACVRLDRLGQGYRFVRLRDAAGRTVRDAALLVKVEKTLIDAYHERDSYDRLTCRNLD